MRPNFLYIGPDKAGSTWIFEILRRHPQCWIPPAKDLFFFDRYYHRGLDWYLSFFEGAPPGARAVGELSHDYLFSGEAAERIRRDLPGVRLLTSLRDPVERTFSHYLYLVRSGRTRAPFEEALERFPELVEHSRYHLHLSRWFRRFPGERIKVLFYEDLRADPEGYARELFAFLGVDFVPGLPYRERFLPASRPRSPLLARLMKVGANAARELGLPDLVGRVKRGPVARLLYRPYREGERPEMRPETRAHLRERFREEVEALEALLGRDLSRWLRPGAAAEEVA